MILGGRQRAERLTRSDSMSDAKKRPERWPSSNSRLPLSSRIETGDLYASAGRAPRDERAPETGHRLARSALPQSHQTAVGRNAALSGSLSR